MRAGVVGDLPEGRFERAAQDAEAYCLVADELDEVERRDGLEQGDAPSRDQALFDGCAGRRPGEATACAVDFLAWTGLALVAVATDGPPEGPSCSGFPACGRPELSRARQAQAENGAPG